MGQKQAKVASDGGAKSVDVARLLNEDTAALKAWAKDNNVSNELLLFEAIQKRRAVFTSGKRCGDSDESLGEKLAKLVSIVLCSRCSSQTT